jgi:hypothetical protein
VRKPGGKIRVRLGLVRVFALVSVGVAGCSQGPQTQRGTPEESQRASPTSAGRAAERYDLSKDEERGGHTLERHVARADEELRQRLRRERNISAAST